MRPSSIVILTLALATAAGQRSGGGASRGGMHTGPPTLTFGNPFTNARVSTPMGAGPLGQWNGNHGSQGVRPYAPQRWWRGAPVIVGPDYPLTYPPYYPDLANPYQGAPQFDPTALPDATELSPSTMEPGVTRNQSNGCSVGQSGEVTANKVSEASRVESFRMETVAIPERESTANDYHPPLIALKNNWAYTANKYWTEGKTFHFVTTQGDHMRVPVGLVERI